MMGKPMLLLTTIVALVGGTTAVSAQREEMPLLRTSELKIDPANPVIDLSVTESITSAPDIATFSTGVESSAPKARDAIQKNAVKMQAVLAQLKGMGIAEKDIQTSALALRRDVDYLPTGKTRFKGYTVSNQITATLRDLSRLGDVLDALATGGATEFYGPNFALDNDTTAKTQARDKAWATAMQMAQYHAKKAGFTGVRVVRVAESVSQVSSYNSKMAVFDVAEEAASDAARVSTPMEPGEIATGVTLTVSFTMSR
jgi:uncharacterized protein